MGPTEVLKEKERDRLFDTLKELLGEEGLSFSSYTRAPGHDRALRDGFYFNTSPIEESSCAKIRDALLHTTSKLLTEQLEFSGNGNGLFRRGENHFCILTGALAFACWVYIEPQP